jgi:signal peptidase II
MNEIQMGKRRWHWLLISLAVVIADQLSKAYVVRHLGEFEVRTVFPFLDVTLMHNTGAAFSFLASASGWQRWFFIALASAVCIALAFWLCRLRVEARRLLALALSLVLGGALGNVIDRIRFGSVVDFIHFHWHFAYFPAFNVADSAITVGAGCLLLDALLDSRRKS